MRSKRIRNVLIGLIFTVTAMMTISIALSYNGFIEAKSACVESNGTITEENVDVLALNWSVSCEQ
ncbi:hypothetical protein [Natribacillus halophilus]|uniref:Uncharacterized protein n=1 Tax=Natribacillus halophilus TaxID=549003 RepID=A0A1G8STR2_9BACI|nr:hypothetical protein [Natribacillus halophilus]SDJ32626.1 hypothetical protein SAMN04488123_1365 [Natribacillus halophilus]